MSASRVIHTERLELRPLTETDRTWIDTIYGDERVTRGFGMAAFSPEALNAKMSQLLGPWAVAGFSQFLVIDRSSGEVTGLGGIRPTDTPGSGEIGYVFSPAWWGKGIASEAILAWIEWGFSDLCLETIVADGVENPASVRALQKAGFVIYEETEALASLRLDALSFPSHS